MMSRPPGDLAEHREFAEFAGQSFKTTQGLGGLSHSDYRRFGSSTNRGQGSPLRAWARRSRRPFGRIERHRESRA